MKDQTTKDNKRCVKCGKYSKIPDNSKLCTPCIIELREVGVIPE